MPDTLVIIFFVAILTVWRHGLFRRDVRQQEVQYQVDGQPKPEGGHPHSFRILTNEAGEAVSPGKLFTTGDERPGLMNSVRRLNLRLEIGTAVGIIMLCWSLAAHLASLCVPAPLITASWRSSAIPRE
ncbi:hypothetical protein ACNKHK_15125 [Shigella flexneri]